ncbi:hypothetical protein [Aquimarina sediminis]|uniref:hypothetical protein n=1 Tax=Aquimarina sediminis TaxID=2070536 RepID=UPI000CA02CF2|nr:hypothetical protein [Aquimarina sediminis]
MLYFLIINLFELLAAVAGTIYLKKAKYREDKLTRYFVWFLWLTVFVEIFGWNEWLIDKVEELAYFGGTILGNNLWVYNIYIVVSALFYSFLMKENTDSKKGNVFLKITMMVYFLLSICDFVFTDIFFTGISFVAQFLGSILVLLSVLQYFYKILQSDKILSFHKELPFYIAIGTMTLYLVVTPLFIHLKYYSSKSPDFVNVYQFILMSANIFTYSCYTIGFIVCSRKNKSY